MRANRWAWTHRHAVPMFVASVVAVIVSGAAFTAVVLFDPNRGPGDAPGAGAPGTLGDDAECLVGSWRVVSMTQGTAGGIVSLLDGQLVLVGEGPVFEFQADGTGLADYGDATVFEAHTLGEAVEMEIRGQIGFGFQAADGVLRLVDPTSNAEATMPLVGTFPYQLDTEPVSFTCDEQVSEFRNDERQYVARYERIT